MLARQVFDDYLRASNEVGQDVMLKLQLPDVASKRCNLPLQLFTIRNVRRVVRGVSWMRGPHHHVIDPPTCAAYACSRLSFEL